MFSSLLFLGYEVAVGAEERRRHFRTMSALWKAPRFIDWAESPRIAQFDAVRERAPNRRNHQDTAINCIRPFEEMGLPSAAFKVGSLSPNQGHDGTAGRIISRIARHTQVGETSRLDSFPYRGESRFWLTIDYNQQ
jgi:hypothetical protein